MHRLNFHCNKYNYVHIPIYQSQFRSENNWNKIEIIFEALLLLAGKVL